MVQPQWTARMYPGTVGRDHLGLGSVSSFQILASLSPGVNVLTFHPRYHSFYVFLLDEFWRRDRPRTNQAWIQFYRPRAFIYSVATHLKQLNAGTSLGSIIGGQKVGPLVTEGFEGIDLLIVRFNQHVERHILNLTPLHHKILDLLGPISPTWSIIGGTDASYEPY